MAKSTTGKCFGYLYIISPDQVIVKFIIMSNKYDDEEGAAFK